jgi:hypothetical protein
MSNQFKNVVKSLLIYIDKNVKPKMQLRKYQFLFLEFSSESSVKKLLREYIKIEDHIEPIVKFTLSQYGIDVQKHADVVKELSNFIQLLKTIDDNDLKK